MSLIFVLNLSLLQSIFIWLGKVSGPCIRYGKRSVLIGLGESYRHVTSKNGTFVWGTKKRVGVMVVLGKLI